MAEQPIKHTDFMDQDLWALSESLRQIAAREVERLAEQLDRSTQGLIEGLTDDRANEHNELVETLTDVKGAVESLTEALDKNLSRIADYLYEIDRRR